MNHLKTLQDTLDRCGCGYIVINPSEPKAIFVYVGEEEERQIGFYRRDDGLIDVVDDGDFRVDDDSIPQKTIAEKVKASEALDWLLWMELVTLEPFR